MSGIKENSKGETFPQFAPFVKITEKNKQGIVHWNTPTIMKIISVFLQNMDNNSYKKLKVIPTDVWGEEGGRGECLPFLVGLISTPLFVVNIDPGMVNVPWNCPEYARLPFYTYITTLSSQRSKLWKTMDLKFHLQVFGISTPQNEIKFIHIPIVHPFFRFWSKTIVRSKVECYQKGR